ncbi:MAG: metal-sulfur cluster assembly factor [Candidatus Altiarchaeota archaeon]|nr:metal-sulfur cluster assembly factor [Candidatus Altiarchaeota archaeon]
MSKEKVMKALKEVLDPELGVNIVDLGFIYEVKVKDKKAHIKMTLSTPMCPLSSLITGDVEKEVKKAGFEPEVELVFDPVWTPDRLSDDLKKKIMGDSPK